MNNSQTYQCEWCHGKSEHKGLCYSCAEKIAELDASFDNDADRDACLGCGKPTMNSICIRCTQMAQEVPDEVIWIAL